MSEREMARRIRAAKWAWQRGQNGPPSQRTLARLLEDMRSSYPSLMGRDALAYMAGMEEGEKSTAIATAAREYLELVKEARSLTPAFSKALGIAETALEDLLGIPKDGAS